MTGRANTREKELARRRAISDAQKRLWRGEGYIYVASWGPGTIKIGCALDVEKRMRALKQDYLLAEVPKVLATVRGFLDDEKILHDKLNLFLGRRLRVGREVYPVSILSHPAIPEELRRAAS